MADKVAIKTQLDFYFSDSNYPRDKFLRSTAAQHDGYVPLATIASFARMKQLSASEAVLAELIKESETLQLSDDGTKVKRKAPMPEKDTINERSVYLRGLPVDDSSVTIDSIQKLMSQFGKVLSVRLRRDQEKKFKGKAYVEFDTTEVATKASDAKTVKYTNGPTTTEVTIVSKPEYFKERKQKQKDKKNELKRARDESKVDAKDAYKAGLILQVNEVPTETERDMIKDVFTRFGAVRYVDFYAKDEQKALVRFTEATSAAAALAGIQKGEVKIGEKVVTQAKLLEGEEDTKYWAEKVTPFLNKNRTGGHQFKKRRF